MSKFEHRKKLCIQRVLKQCHPDAEISHKAVNKMNDFIDTIAFLLVENLIQQKRKVTVEHVKIAVQNLIGGELADHGVSAIGRAFRRLEERKNNPTYTNLRCKAGLLFTTAFVQKETRRVGIPELPADACIALMALLEYIAAEILELSGNAAWDDAPDDVEYPVILTRHLRVSVKRDEELDPFTKKINFSFV